MRRLKRLLLGTVVMMMLCVTLAGAGTAWAWSQARQSNVGLLSFTNLLNIAPGSITPSSDWTMGRTRHRLYQQRKSPRPCVAYEGHAHAHRE